MGYVTQDFRGYPGHSRHSEGGYATAAKGLPSNTPTGTYNTQFGAAFDLQQSDTPLGGEVSKVEHVPFTQVEDIDIITEVRLSTACEFQFQI